MDLAAQVGVYSLRQPRLSPAIERALARLEEAGLEVEPGPMSSIILGDSASLFAGLRAAFEAAAEEGETVMVVTVSNACPLVQERRP